jgi:hypothetical protein
MNMEPRSRLSAQRPDIWARALTLATGLTGCTYAHKEPRANGTIYACGSYEIPPSTLEEQLEDAKWHREGNIKDGGTGEYWQGEVDRLKVEIEKRDKKKPPSAASSMFVPEGEMEWLLHEVGHWVAATPAERLLPNYGLHDDIAFTQGGFEKIVVPSTGLLAEREWQAWGFEEIILQPWGPSRLLASPTQQDGVAFSKPGPMPHFAMRHAERQMDALNVDIEEWRSVYGDWMQWQVASKRDASDIHGTAKK